MSDFELNVLWVGMLWVITKEESLTGRIRNVLLLFLCGIIITLISKYCM